MDRFNVSATVDDIELNKKVMASSEEEAVKMCENHLRWIYPTKKIEMGEVTKETSPERIRMRGKNED